MSRWWQDIGGLEVIGSGKPSASVPVCRSPQQEKEAQEEEEEQDGMEGDIMWGKKKTNSFFAFSNLSVVATPAMFLIHTLPLHFSSKTLDTSST